MIMICQPCPTLKRAIVCGHAVGGLLGKPYKVGMIQGKAYVIYAK